MKYLSHFTRRASVILGLLLGCGNTQAEEFGIEWEMTFRPFEFWDPATLAFAQVFADEKGGCVVRLDAARANNQGRKQFFIFLDQHGEEKYRFELTSGSDGNCELVSSERAVIRVESGNTSHYEVIRFGETGEVVRNSTPNTFGTSLLSNGGLRTDNRSFWYVDDLSSESAGGLIRNAVIRKLSFGSDDSPEPAPVLFSGVNGDNAIVAWKTKVGSQYQVQKSTDLESWSDIGLPITGTGERMNYSEANLGEPLYLRIVVL
ncbi:hypothetical protein OAK69_00575 [bacterium]|nr:hypothetical protein [bacterium]